MGITLHKYVNALTDTNTFALVDSHFKNIIIVDPGISSGKFIIELACKFNVNSFDVLLTHHHFDHVGGIQYLRSLSNYIFRVFSSSVCSQLMQNPKTNLSSFYHSCEKISISESDVILPALSSYLELNSFCVDVFFTPGHTSGCMSYRIGEFIFVGDLMISHARTVTKLPTGNQSQAEESITFLLNYSREKKLTICPGHGLSFQSDLLEVSDFVNA